MKLEKKHYVIIAVIAVILVWYFFLRKKKAESSYRVASSSAHPKCWPGTTWRDWCACCLPDNPSERRLSGNNKTLKNAVKNIG